MDTDYALGGGQSTKAQLYLHVLCNNCIGSSWVDETMGIRAEKWIGNMCGRSNQNVWRAASSFEAIRVDGSWKRSVIWHHGIPAQVEGCSRFLSRLVRAVQALYGSYIP